MILAIDTSFDDTAVSVTNGITILSNALSTDLSVHQEWGGVVPNLARLHHTANIDAVIDRALRLAHISWTDLEAIAVTKGPGLAIALEVGIARAKELSLEHQIPLIAVNHMEGHLLSFLARPKKKSGGKALEWNMQEIFPAMGVLISGGHTQFVYTKEIGSYAIVGETQDDAIGECFDKVGRMLGLGYPAGKLIEKMAEKGTPGKYLFPVPMRQVKTADTSYSGLKTAAMRMIDGIKDELWGKLSAQDIADVSLAFQDAAIKHLIEKLTFAMQPKPVQSIIVGGGVAANTVVRARLRHLAKEKGIPVYFPYSKKLCTDNAAMIGIAASLHTDQGKVWSDDQLLDRLPNWTIDQY